MLAFGAATSGGFFMLNGRIGQAIALGIMVTIGSAATVLAQEEFPFSQELLLDARPMKGSKRIPSIEVEADGTATIDLWCNSVQGQMDVNGAAITISLGEKTDRTCAPERAQADDDLMAALQQITSWRWDGESVTLIGPKTLRFRQQTN
jgi:heat shock protein HslJ